MKKSIYIFAALLAAMACTKEIESPVVEETQENQNYDGAVTVLGASIGEEYTKTALGDKDGSAYKLIWTTDDAIAVNGLTSTKTDIDAENASNAKFTFEGELSAPYCAVYPASAYVAASYNYSSEATMQITIPATQTYSAGQYDSNAAIMLAYGDGNNLTFQQAAGYYKLSISGTEDTDAIKTIKIRKRDGGKIAGTYNATFTGTGCTLAETDVTDVITVDCGAGVAQGTDIFVVLPAINFTKGLIITAYDVNGHFHSFGTAAVDFAGASRGQILAKSLSYTPASGTINTVEDWTEFCNQLNSKDLYRFVGNGTVKLGANITLSEPFARPTEIFTYTFDGNGKTITINDAENPLFNKLGAGGVIKNLTTAGTLVNSGESEGKVILVTTMTGGTIQDCTNNANITVSNITHHVASAAFVRMMSSGQILRCVNNGNITLSVDATAADLNCYAAGIVGRINGNTNGESVLLQNCENNGKVVLSITNTDHPVGYCAAAGIAAWVSRSSTDKYPIIRFDNCDNSGNVLLQTSDDSKVYASYVGGIIGIGAGCLTANVLGVATSSDNQNKIFFDKCDNTGQLMNKAVSQGAAARINSKSFVGGLAAAMFGFEAVFGEESTPIFNNCTSSGNIVPYDNAASTRPGIESVAGGFVGIGANISFKDCTVTAQVGTASRLAFAVSGGIGLAVGKFRFDGCTFCPKVIMGRSFNSAKDNWSLIATYPQNTGTANDRDQTIYYNSDSNVGLPSIAGSTVKNCKLGSWGLSINTATVDWNATNATLSAIKTKFDTIDHCKTFVVQGTTSGAAYCGTAGETPDVAFTDNTGTGMAASQPEVTTTPVTAPMMAALSASAPVAMTLSNTYNY